MLNLTTAVAAENWAIFSGDWNPIHFDQDAAKAVGADRLVVHGMLALLRVKQETSSQVLELCSAPAEQQFGAYFRIPALQGSVLQLDVRKKGGGVSFNLHADEYLCIRGSHAVADGWDETQSTQGNEETRCIDGAKVASKYNQFHSRFPFISHKWIFLDALIFADFLGDYFKTEVPLSKGFAPVQMSHRVKFNSAAIDALNLDGTHAPTFLYSIKKIEGPSSGIDRFGIAELTVSTKDGLLMRTEIGLLAKSISQPQLDLQLE